MENYSILEVLYQEYTKFQEDEDYKQANTEFVQSLRAYIKDKDVVFELEDLASDIEFISSKLFFRAGFKYGIQVAKECGLL